MHDLSSVFTLLSRRNIVGNDKGDRTVEERLGKSS